MGGSYENVALLHLSKLCWVGRGGPTKTFNANGVSMIFKETCIICVLKDAISFANSEIYESFLAM